MFKVGDKVRTRYFSSPVFTGTIVDKECINNGRYPKYAYHIVLDNPMEYNGELRNRVCFVDRDQAQFNNILTVSEE